MRIIVDAMGGDNAPEEIVKGAVRAKRELGVDVTLVGIEDKVRACLKAEGCADGEIEVVNASEIITMLFSLMEAEYPAMTAEPKPLMTP